MYSPKKSIRYGINFILLLLVVLCHSRLVAQTPPPLPVLATGVNENVFATVQETYYVAPDGNDINPGNLSLPFKTFSKGVNKAVERKNAGISVKIILRNGTYREKKFIAASANAPNNACIIIEAENKGEAIISGSEDWSGQWTQVGSNWTHAWIFNWGIAPSYSKVTNELGRRREMFFVNKVLYTQVLSQTNLTDGTYYVDETGDKAYIRPLPGVNMATALIEVGMLEKVFTINADQKNIAIKGLVFQHDASFPVGAGANEGVFRVGKDCSNMLIEDVSIEWNNGAGLGTIERSEFRQDITFRRVKINNNGGGGFSFGLSQNLLFEDCETSYNRFRGKWAGQAIGTSPGGFKLASTHRTSFIRHKVIGNYGRGMWWDIANRDMTAKDCYVDGNYGSGIFVEYNFGPALIENCTIINTNESVVYTLRNHSGLQFASTANLTIKNCIIKNNVQSQIKCWDQQRTMTDHITGQVKRFDASNVGNVYIQGNTVEAKDTTQSLIDIPDWTYLISTWGSNNNTYIHRKKNAAFRVYPGGTEEGDDGSDVNYFLATYYTFEEWKNLIDGDANSTYNAFFTFSLIDSYFGNAVNYEPLNLSRWSVLYKGDNQGYAINTGNYTNLSGQRLGEYALVKNRSYGNFTMTLKAASAENFSTNTSPDYAVVFGYQDADNYAYINFTNTATELFRVVAGARQSAIATSTLAAFSDTAYKAIEVSRAGNKVVVKQGNTLLLNSTNPALSATGNIGIGSFDDAAYFEDILIQEQVLPIKLTSFTATSDGRKVNLKWTTATETNNDYFTVERSADGNNFIVIATVKGAGNSSQHKEYSTIDQTPFTGINYYRIKQTDIDGHYSFSEIKSVKISNGHVAKLIVWPNPIINKSTITYQLAQASRVLLEVFTIEGKKVATLVNGIQQAGTQEIIYDSRLLAEGIYLVKLATGIERYALKLLVAK